jgi:DNA-binding transcriptional regulator YiaG
MPNIALLIKVEIERVAKKQIKAAISPIVHKIAILKTEQIASKKLILELQQSLKQLAKSRHKLTTASAVKSVNSRITTQGVKSLRKRLGLTAAEVGLLCGTTGAAVYKWESGEAYPRPAQVAAIVSLRRLGKKSARVELNAMHTSAQSSDS